MATIRILVMAVVYLIAGFPDAVMQAWATASSPARVALLIANADYPGDAILPTPNADSEKLADALRRLGFSTDVQKNLTKQQMEARIDHFLGTIEAGSVAFFFFAGHGIQVEGKNYLIPTNAHIWNEADVQRDGLSLEGLQAKLAQREAKARIIVIDASRRNPYERQFRSVSSGLAATAGTPGLMSIFATAGGEIVPEGTSPNSMFVTELVAQIGLPNRSAIQAFEACRDAVSRRTGNRQIPYLTADIDSTVSFDERWKISETADQPKSSVPGTEQDSRPATQGRPVKSYSSADLARKSELDARIANYPNDEASTSERGQLLALHGEFRSALLDFDRSTQLNPKNVKSWNNRCWVRAILNELEQALADCSEALRLRPKFGDALDSRGLVHLKQGDLHAAIADYSEALQVNAMHSSAYYGRGLVRLRLGQNDEAEKDFQRAKNIDPNIDREYQEYGLR